MHICVTAIICTLIFTVLVSVVFFSKKRISLPENEIYSFLLILSSIGLILELGCCYFVANKDVSILHKSINLVINKAFLVYMLTWLITFMFYIYFITFKSNVNTKKLKVPVFIEIVYVLLLVPLLLLPINYFYDGNYVYSFGMGPNFVTFVGAVTILFNIFCIVKNIKNIKNKKYYPVYVLIFLMIIALILRNINPGLVLINSIFGFITGLMFFTIENPDAQTINEMYKNKELLEQTYEDKSNFLFELTQEVRNPLFKIANICNELKSENSNKALKEGIEEVSHYVRQLDFIVNDVLNVGTLSSNKIKFIDNRYDVNRMFNEIVSKINSCKNDKVDFITTISHNIPYLYGDSIKLKQILLSILLNAVKKTESGFIEFHIDTIDRFDVCRLIFTIRDSGTGISIEKINEILAATGELNQEDIENVEKINFNMKLCQKIVKLMGGSLMVKSEIGKGTEVTLVVDQKIYNPKNSDKLYNQYQGYINSNKSILIVCQNKELGSLLKKKYTDNNIHYSYVLYGMDAVDKVKRGKKYDYILVEDEMEEMSGYTTLQELKNIEKFDIPVIIMLKKNKEQIIEHYLKDGFKDCLLIDDFTKDIERIMSIY